MVAGPSHRALDVHGELERRGDDETPDDDWRDLRGMCRGSRHRYLAEFDREERDPGVLIRRAGPRTLTSGPVCS